MATNNAVNNASGSSLILLSSKTASGSPASLAFTSVISGTYDTYQIVITNLVPSTSAIPKMESSTNNGSSYLVAGYFAGCNCSAYNSTSFTNTNFTTLAPLAIATSATAGTGISCTLILSTATGLLSGYGIFNSSALGQGSLTLISAYMGSTSVNAFLFAFSGGATISSGTISVFGILL